MRRTEHTLKRLLVIGDSHGHAGMLANACSLAKDVQADEVWSVGDFGIWPGRGGRAFLDSVEYDAKNAGVTVRVVPGNHDDYDQIEETLEAEGGAPWGHLRPHVLVAKRGVVHTIGSAHIMCLSGAASIDGPGGIWWQARGPGNGWWEQERISEKDVEYACRNIDDVGGRIHLMVCHDVPDSTRMTGQADFPLGEEIRQRIRRVAEHGGTPLLVAGHWHRYLDQNIGGRREIILSADIKPEERQWILVDIMHGKDTPEVVAMEPWSPSQALT